MKVSVVTGVVGLVSLALLAIAVKARAISSDDTPVVEFRGKVVPYKPAVEAATKIEISNAAIDKLLCLQTSDGKLLPILPTDLARFFYDDTATRSKDVLLTVRQHRQTPMLDIVRIQAVVNGKPVDFHYWCSVCAIKMYRKQECSCCQGPVELHTGR